MTYERRIVVSLDDILLVSYECKTCGARTSFSPDKTLEAASVCFQCRAEWQKGNVAASSTDPLYTRKSLPLRLMEAVSSLRNPDIASNLGFKVLFEFQEPVRSDD